jgi:hypothetical protein
MPQQADAGPDHWNLRLDVPKPAPATFLRSK